MADDWIKMRSNLQRHPKVVRIASALKADRLRVIGGLHAVWCLFDEHSDDGHLHGYTCEAVDELVGWPGFTGQLEAVKWVQWDGADSLFMPEFATHNGASAKRRAQEANRKRAERAVAKSGPQAVRGSSASPADKMPTREENRREEVNTPPPPVRTGGCGQVTENSDTRRPQTKQQWRWRTTFDGYVARGKQLGIEYSTAALGNSWTDDELQAHRRQFKRQVEQADQADTSMAAAA